MSKVQTHTRNIDSERIEQAVKSAELKGHGEIVPAILKQSDIYPAAHFRSALLFALATPMIMYFLPWNYHDPIWYIWPQIPALILGYALCFHPRAKRFFSTASELNEEVHQKALEVFFHRQLHATKQRSGILILVSLLEHRVEIIADTGVNAKVEKNTWNKLLKALLKEIKAGNTTQGMCDIIEKCGVILNEHFPLEEVSQSFTPNPTTNPNELADGLITGDITKV